MEDYIIFSCIPETSAVLQGHIRQQVWGWMGISMREKTTWYRRNIKCTGDTVPPRAAFWEQSHTLIFSPEHISLNLAPDLLHRDHSAATAHHLGSYFRALQACNIQITPHFMGNNSISFQYPYQSLLNFLIHLTRTSLVLLSKGLWSHYIGLNYTYLINQLYGRAAILSSKLGQNWPIYLQKQLEQTEAKSS